MNLNLNLRKRVNWIKERGLELRYYSLFKRNESVADQQYVAMVDGKPAGALIRNHVMAPGYEEIEWSLDIPAEEVFVIHTLTTSDLNYI